MAIRNLVSSINKFFVCIVGVLIFAFLLKIWHIWVVVQSLIEVVDVSVGQYFGAAFNEFMIVIEAKLCFSVIDFI